MPIIIKHIEPSDDLKLLVHRFWEVSTTDAAKLRVLPDGSWDFVVHVCGDSYQLEFVGPMTKAAIIPLAPDVRSYGVRFRPGVYFELLKTDLADYQGVSIPLTQLIPEVSLQTEEPILPQLAALIKTLVERGAFTRNQVVDENLAKPLSSRTVERKFRRYVGLSPKQFARINRQLAVARELLLQHYPNLGRLAADFDYVDQAHMTHDIRLLAGTTPKALHDEYDGFLQYDWPYEVHTSKA
ncbi:MAG: helix-turn-helix domain-containing protein [Candidatus Saccharimonadales bacterium]